MIFEITQIADVGDLERERVIIKAREAGDLGRFAVFRALASSDGKVKSGNIPNAYWFEDKQIKAGDFAVLYTKAGTRSEKLSDSGSTSHFYYWGFSSSIWTATYKPVLVNTATWSFKSG